MQIKYRKSAIIAISVLVLIWAAFGIKSYLISRQKVDLINICQDDELITKLITQNINPFSKFKFIKKRNQDCGALLAMYKKDAETGQPVSYCSIVDSATVSVTMLVNTYVKDMYDRVSASKELKTMLSLMAPYSYCAEYYADILLLVELKQKYGLQK